MGTGEKTCHILYTLLPQPYCLSLPTPQQPSPWAVSPPLSSFFVEIGNTSWVSSHQPLHIWATYREMCPPLHHPHLIWAPMTFFWGGGLDLPNPEIVLLGKSPSLLSVPFPGSPASTLLSASQPRPAPDRLSVHAKCYTVELRQKLYPRSRERASGRLRPEIQTRPSPRSGW